MSASPDRSNSSSAEDIGALLIGVILFLCLLYL